MNPNSTANVASELLKQFDDERAELDTSLECIRARISAGDLGVALQHLADAQLTLGRIEEALEDADD